MSTLGVKKLAALRSQPIGSPDQGPLLPTLSAQSVTIAALCGTRAVADSKAVKDSGTKRAELPSSLTAKLASSKPYSNLDASLEGLESLSRPEGMTQHWEKSPGGQGLDIAVSDGSDVRSPQSPDSRIPPVRHPWFASHLSEGDNNLLNGILENPSSVGVAVPLKVRGLKLELAGFKDVSTIPPFKGPGKP